MRCWQDVRKPVKRTHWPSTADTCISGYEKKYSGLDVADRCWKTTCTTKRRRCTVFESCCNNSWYHWGCRGFTSEKQCTAQRYNDKRTPRYETVAVAHLPNQCRQGWVKDPSGALCYPKCKSGYQMVGPMCWWKSEGRRLQQAIAQQPIRNLRGSERV